MARAKRLCPGGCKRIVSAGGRCDECTKALEARRGSRHQRGYGIEHDRRRKQLVGEALRADRAGTPLPCPVCGEPLRSFQRLEAGHSIPLARDPSSLADIVVHADGCNPRGTHPFNR